MRIRLPVATSISSLFFQLNLTTQCATIDTLIHPILFTLRCGKTQQDRRYIQTCNVRQKFIVIHEVAVDSYA